MVEPDGRHWGYYAPVGPRHSPTREPSTLLIIMRKTKIMVGMIKIVVFMMMKIKMNFDGEN